LVPELELVLGPVLALEQVLELEQELVLVLEQVELEVV
jgi:hypothetical protein